MPNPDRFDQRLVRLLITVRKRSCGKVMFSQACVKNSVHGGCVSQHALGQTPIPPPAVTAADRKHPTGMHSCFLFKLAACTSC